MTIKVILLVLYFLLLSGGYHAETCDDAGRKQAAVHGDGEQAPQTQLFGEPDARRDPPVSCVLLSSD